jgi:hypothetical protein
MKGVEYKKVIYLDTSYWVMLNSCLQQEISREWTAVLFLKIDFLTQGEEWQYDMTEPFHILGEFMGMRT